MSDPSKKIGRIGDWSKDENAGAGGREGGSGGTGSGGGHGGYGPGVHHLVDEDDDGENDREDWYAGGERSGLSVHNPNGRSLPGVVRDLLDKSARAGPPPPAPEASTSRAAFSGGGHTLGSDDVASTYIAGSERKREDEQHHSREPVVRNLTFWRNGFSVGDGPLLSYDDPQNARTLKLIQEGLAPPELLGVEVGQPVEVRVTPRADTDYIAPERSWNPFEGTGHRLGSVTASVAGPGALSRASVSTIASPHAASEPERLQTKFEVDQSQPTTSVQIRLADGTRLVCRMNLTHTVGDVRNFIIAARPENRGREFTISTPFPNRTLDDDTLTIQKAGLANSVIVQRWV